MIGFEEVKKKLTKAHVLIMYDASFKCQGCVLMQKGKVIAYAVRELRPHKVNYPVHNIELSVVIVVLMFGDIICIGYCVRSTPIIKT